MRKAILEQVGLGIFFICMLLQTQPMVMAQVALQNPNTFYFATPQEPTSLDPAIIYDGSDRATRLAYEPLLNFQGSTYNVEPSLAQSWDISPDFKTYTFHLRQGVTFSDGTPFNAQAVKFSYTRMLQIGKGLAWAFKLVMGKWNETRIDVLDNYTVRMTLKAGYVPFIKMVASRYASPIISPSIMAHQVSGDLGRAYAHDHTIGTGPYVITQWIHNVEVDAAQNPTYWRGWQGNHFTNVVMKIIPDLSTERLMLQNGDVDSATSLSFDDLALIRANSTTVKLANVGSSGVANINIYIMMNTRKGVLKDIRLRQALSYALDYSSTVGVLNGFAKQSIGPMTVDMPGHANVFQYQQNMTKAKELMAAAGYPNGGLTLTLAYPRGSDIYAKILGVFTSNMAQLGITVTPSVFSFFALVDKLSNQNTAPDLVIADWYPDYPDPDSFLSGECQYYFWGGRTPDNYWYYNQTLSDLLDTAAFESNMTKRQSMYALAQTMLVQDAPAIWVVDTVHPVPLRQEVQGYEYNPMYELTYTVYNMYLGSPSASSTMQGASSTMQGASSTMQGVQGTAFPTGTVAAVAAVIILGAAFVAYRRSKAKKPPSDKS